MSDSPCWVRDPGGRAAGVAGNATAAADAGGWAPLSAAAEGALPPGAWAFLAPLSKAGGEGVRAREALEGLLAAERAVVDRPASYFYAPEAFPLVACDVAALPGPEVADLARALLGAGTTGFVAPVGAHGEDAEGAPRALEALEAVSVETGAPVVGALSGAVQMRRPFVETLINLRPSNADEAYALVSNLPVDKSHRVSLVYEDDPEGEAVLTAMKDYQRSVGNRVYTSAAFEPGAFDPAAAADAIFAGEQIPETVVLYSREAADLAALMKEVENRLGPEGYKAMEFATFSDADAEELHHSLAALSVSVKPGQLILSQVVPDPRADAPIAAEYRAGLGNVPAAAVAVGAETPFAEAPPGQPGYVSFETFMAGVFTSTVLGEMSDKVDLWETPPSALRDTFLRQVYSDGVVDLLGDWRFGPYGDSCNVTQGSYDGASYDGALVGTGCDCNQGARSVFLTFMGAEGHGGNSTMEHGEMDHGEMDHTGHAGHAGGVDTARHQGSYALEVAAEPFAFDTCGYEPPEVRPIVLGQSCALTGKNQALGIGVSTGLAAAFVQASEMGGVRGRPIELVSLDDGYEPEPALWNSQALLGDNATRLAAEEGGDEIFTATGYPWNGEPVLFLVGEVGTPTTIAVVGRPETPERERFLELGVPFVGAFTGAGLLRDPFVEEFVNVRASYADEIVVTVNHLVKDLGLDRISILHQDDGFGQAGFNPLVETLSGLYNLPLYSDGKYERNTLDVQPAFDAIFPAGEPGPQAVFCMGAYAPIAEFVKLVKETHPEVVVSVISFAGAEALSEALGPAYRQGVLMTQVTPSPRGSSEVAAMYRSALSAYDPSFPPSYASFEGYLDGRLSAMALQRIPQEMEITRESFLDAVYTGNYQVAEDLTLGPYVEGECNQGMKDVWLTEFQSNGTISETGPPFRFETCQAAQAIAAQTEANSLNLPLIIGVVCGGAAVLVLGLAGGLFLYFRRTLARSQRDAIKNTWLVNYEDIVFEHLLGEGASGFTFYGKYRDTPVIIKQVKYGRAGSKGSNSNSMSNSRSTGQDQSSMTRTTSPRPGSGSGFFGTDRAASRNERRREQLEKEAHLLHTLRHPNIRLFMGAYIPSDDVLRKARRAEGRQEGDQSGKPGDRSLTMPDIEEGEPLTSPAGPPGDDLLHPRSSVYIISEYMSRGTLHDVLTNPLLEIDMAMQLNMLKDVARGMNFLHKHDPPILHCDVKSRNMLIDERWVVKVGDFGHSLVLDEAHANSNIQGTPYWTAPEVLGGEPNTPASDVYSFGIVMWEVFSRKEPYDGFEGDASDAMEQIVLEGLRPDKLTTVSPDIMALMESCWQHDPAARPDFEALLSTLEKFDAPAIRQMQPGGAAAATAGGLVKRMLPDKVAKALEAGQSVEPEYFDESTILFSDIVGFTSIASAFPPSEVMGMLDRLYTAFDALTTKHDVFKVETVGDAYMVVGGVPLPQEDHAVRIAKMALDMVEVAATIPVSLVDESFGNIHIRVGMHSGPVVASVVGDLNPRYTLFGDTVNTASRMESTSLANMVQVSENARRRLDAMDVAFALQPRGETEVKGKGKMQTYWLRPAGHLLLLNWLNVLVTNHGVPLEKVRSMPEVFLTTAHSDAELLQVLELRDLPCYELAAEILEEQEGLVIANLLGAPRELLALVTEKEHLEQLMLWQPSMPYYDLAREEIARDPSDAESAFRTIAGLPFVLVAQVDAQEDLHNLMSWSGAAHVQLVVKCIEADTPAGCDLQTFIDIPLTVLAAARSRQEMAVLGEWQQEGWAGFPWVDTILRSTRDWEMQELAQAREDLEFRFAYTADRPSLKPLHAGHPAGSADPAPPLSLCMNLPDTLRSNCTSEGELRLILSWELLAEQTIFGVDLLGALSELVSGLQGGAKKLGRTGSQEEISAAGLTRRLSFKEAVKEAVTGSQEESSLRDAHDVLTRLKFSLLSICVDEDELEAVFKWAATAVPVAQIVQILVAEPKWMLSDIIKVPFQLLELATSAPDIGRLLEWVDLEEASGATHSSRFVRDMVAIVCRKQTVPLAVALDTPLNLLGKCEKELDTEKLCKFGELNARNLVWASELVEEGLTTLDDLFLLPTALYAAANTKDELEWSLCLKQLKSQSQTDVDRLDTVGSRTSMNSLAASRSLAAMSKLQSAATKKMLSRKQQLEEELQMLEHRIEAELDLDLDLSEKEGASLFGKVFSTKKVSPSPGPSTSK